MDDTPLPLKDLHLPDPVGWWPLAPGWWFVLLVSVIAIAWGIGHVYRRWRFNAPRRYALDELARIEADYREHRDPVLLGKQLSELLRRGMLAYASREEVAGLTGDAWLEWLDRGMPVPYFHTEGGKHLLDLPYRDPGGDLSGIDVDAMVSAVRVRLRQPLEGRA